MALLALLACMMGTTEGFSSLPYRCKYSRVDFLGMYLYLYLVVTST